MAQQSLSGRSGTQGPRPNARFGAVTKSQQLGSPLRGTSGANQNRGNARMNVANGTRPITPGTKAPVRRGGSGQKRTRGVQ